MSEPIVTRGMPFDEYRKLPGMNCSTLKHGMRSMSHLRWAMEHPTPQSPAMALGSAFHTLASEPEEFDKRYIVGGPINPKTGKQYGSDSQKFAEWVAENANGREVMTQEDYDRAKQMASAIQSLPIAEALLTFPRRDVELAIQWTDEDSGVLCKCRLDLLIHSSPLIIPDLKSTRDARPGPFGKSVDNFGYHMQDAMYSDAVEAAFGELPMFLFLCVESEPPFCAKLNRLSASAKRIGRETYKRILREYAECERCGEWPGYATDMDVIELPRWAEVDSE